MKREGNSMKREYQVDPAHSSALFTVRHMIITNARGAFGGIQGKVSYDAEDVQSTRDATHILKAPSFSM